MGLSIGTLLLILTFFNCYNFLSLILYLLVRLGSSGGGVRSGRSNLPSGLFSYLGAVMCLAGLLPLPALDVPGGVGAPPLHINVTHPVSDVQRLSERHRAMTRGSYARKHTGDL